MSLEDADFPKINRSRITGRKGITILKEVVENDLQWLFRETHLEDDFGIDGHFDIILPEGKVTGKSIAFQLKTGISFFKEKNEIGYVFRGEKKHLNYYLNYSLPILIILANPESGEIFWELFDSNKIDKAPNSWKLTIPKNKILNIKSKIKLLKCVGPITDYTSQLENKWKIDKLLKKHNRIIFTVTEDEIKADNYYFLIDALDRIQETGELMIHLKNKVDISFDDYDFDKRELFEIPEVKNWVINLFKKSNCWPYLMAMDDSSSFMKIALYCHLPDYNKTESNGRFTLEYDPKKALEFVKLVFDKLNQFCEEKNIDMEINRQITDKIINCFTHSAPKKKN